MADALMQSDSSPAGLFADAEPIAVTKPAEPPATDRADQLAADAEAMQRQIEAAKLELASVDLMGAGDGEDPDWQQVLRFVRRKMQLESEIERVKAQAAAIIDSLAGQLHSLDYVFAAHAAGQVRTRLAGRKAKSIKTAFGTVGFRTNPARIEVVDADKALEAAEGMDEPDKFIRVERSIVAAALKERMEATGELWPGCQFVPPVEKFYVK